LIQAKRYYHETGKAKKATGAITNLKNPVFAGQIFAEMLAGICHEEFYRYSDQEVPLPSPPPTVISVFISRANVLIGVRDIYNTYFIPIISRILLPILSQIDP
jgi:hypothetical protein